ncbi:hypothetical protein [Adhaeribacter pallidiroseus]|uniref:Uncharacterized protein n=1 Tax=Adhaeribacter pallidiroseus TaxID=2072847 RepID=A0A369QG84_9BACT|nr:hypothetical protein [Adhaeribacter pallidiroseus]RDC63714.1 hypothetical protein AHMF7616_02322 [Adhaeribacter pallidiroseus]
MLDLNDEKWKDLEGGYKIPYDASVPLLRLEQSSNAQEQENILDELFEELYHQGDVGVASYLSVSHLVRIGIHKKIGTWRVLGLISTIEIARHSDKNPELPSEYKKEYFEWLSKVDDLAKVNANWDRTYTSCALSAIAASKRQIDLAEVILELEDTDLAERFSEFLENY